jgi:hypothetical protein
MSTECPWPVEYPLNTRGTGDAYAGGMPVRRAFLKAHGLFPRAFPRALSWLTEEVGDSCKPSSARPRNSVRAQPRARSTWERTLKPSSQGLLGSSPCTFESPRAPHSKSGFLSQKAQWFRRFHATRDVVLAQEVPPSPHECRVSNSGEAS